MNASAPVAPVLVADVGGTHVRFALADLAEPEPLLAGTTRHYRVADFASFSDALRRYLADSLARPVSAVISAAGPRVHGEVHLTNLSWVISRAQVEAEFGFSQALLINDFAAMALSVPLLKSTDLCSLGEPAPAPMDSAASRTFAIVGAGTGLGVGALLVRSGQSSALETEGGHASFAPGDDEEIEILRVLKSRFGHVSNERLLCGSGLVNLYEALCQIHRVPARMSTPEQITRNADDDPDCRRAVVRFCEMLGALAGDLALVFGAWDGVYLSGGLAQPLERWLAADGFRRRFEDKGRFAGALARVPTSLVLHEDPGLLGAAAFARIEFGRSASGTH